MERQLVLLDAAEQTLAAAAEEDRDEARGRLEQRLVLQLAAYLDRYTDMGEELEALLPARQDGPPPSASPTLAA
ncbi:hypothetical protein [Streptomyces cyaneofuscatus]|uniref:hypothetical protein n=1 Tax=Streptomyces cyaneofuscatus TaxID=66883 RepID=UPI0036462BE9